MSPTPADHWTVDADLAFVNGLQYYVISGEGDEVRALVLSPFDADAGEPTPAEYAEGAGYARLIAAAPELQEALAAFVEIAVLALNHFAEDDTRGMTNAAIDEARALLARLDGRP